MKALALLLALLLGEPAWAQAPAPPASAPPVSAPPAPGAPAAAPAAPPAPPAPVTGPVTWLPRGGAELIGLDKITARRTQLTGRVGQTVTYGSLSIAIRACIVRGPDQPADQAAYLDITDSRDAALGFHGWMLLNEPSVSMLEHPVYDIRLAGCTA